MVNSDFPFKIVYKSRHHVTLRSAIGDTECVSVAVEDWAPGGQYRVEAQDQTTWSTVLLILFSSLILGNRFNTLHSGPLSLRTFRCVLYCLF